VTAGTAALQHDSVYDCSGQLLLAVSSFSSRIVPLLHGTVVVRCPDRLHPAARVGAASVIRR
jgi:hypothetical protein